MPGHVRPQQTYLEIQCDSKLFISVVKLSDVGFFPPYLLEFLSKDSSTSNASSVSKRQDQILTSRILQHLVFISLLDLF